MNLDHPNVLKYWRSSLADSALGKGCFKERDRKNFMELPKSALSGGKLPSNLARKVFEGQKPNVEVVTVRIWPMVTSRKKSHGVTISNRYPDIVAPVVLSLIHI